MRSRGGHAVLAGVAGLAVAAVALSGCSGSGGRGDGDEIVLEVQSAMAQGGGCGRGIPAVGRAGAAGYPFLQRSFIAGMVAGSFT